MFRDRVAGVCHGCANMHVKVTESNQTIATCTAGGNRSRPPVRITEPLAFCNDREPIEMTVEHLPSWMRDLAWTPVVIRPGKVRRKGDFVKTFIPAQETPPGMFDPWQEHTTKAQQEQEDREMQEAMQRNRKEQEEAAEARKGQVKAQQALAAVLEHLAAAKK